MAAAGDVFCGVSDGVVFPHTVSWLESGHIEIELYQFLRTFLPSFAKDIVARVPMNPPLRCSCLYTFCSSKGEKEHGRESRYMNDRVHGISCGIRTKQVNKLIALFLIPN